LCAPVMLPALLSATICALNQYPITLFECIVCAEDFSRRLTLNKVPSIDMSEIREARNIRQVS
jgi:hypothetical protein